MPRTKGSKNKNINTAKNKNIININVNSKTSKRGKGRPRKQTNDTTHNRNSGGGIGGMAPPQIIISPPQQDNSNNSLLSSFMTSKILNESMNLNRTNMTNVEQPTNREQPSYFNARESIIPIIPETPLKQELKPSGNGPPIPPPLPGKGPPEPPPLPGKGPQTKNMFAGLSGQDAINAELKYLASDEGKAEKAKKKAETAAKKEAKKLEKETAPSQQSTTDFLNMSFTPPKRDIVQMLTPSKEPMSTEITPYRENKSMLDFVMGGTPQKTKQQLKQERDVNKLKELKHSKKPKHVFEYNDIKTELTGQPNPNKDIAKSILGEAIKRKAASEKVKKIKTEVAATKIQSLARGVKTRQKLSNNNEFINKIDTKIKKYGDAASEYKTRGADKPNINVEFSDIMKHMRTGLKTYKSTLGIKPNKRGPKPKPEFEF